MRSTSNRSLAVIVVFALLGGIAALGTGNNSLAILGLLAGVVISAVMSRRG